MRRGRAPGWPERGDREKGEAPGGPWASHSGFGFTVRYRNVQRPETRALS